MQRHVARVGQLIGAMKGELNSGIGSQIQSLSVSAVTSGAGAIYNLWATEQDQRNAGPDRKETEEERSARQQAAVDAIEADAEQLTSARMAEEKAAARREAELARRHRDPEPGTLPAVASSKPPVAAVGVDSTAAVETLLQQEQVLEGLASMFAPQQLQEVVDDAKPKGIREYTVETMERWAAESPAVETLCAEDILAHYQVDNSIKEAKGAVVVGLGVATAAAPQVMIPAMGRMAIGDMFGKVMTNVMLENAHSDADVAMAHVAGCGIELMVGSHMPAGGELAKGVALTVPATTTGESGGLLNRLKEAGREAAQWRPDPHAHNC